MLADIGSLGDGGLAGFQRNRRVHRIVRDLKIGDRLLGAVVGHGVRVALDLDDDLRRVRRDGQLAGLVGDFVVVGDGLAAGVLDDRRGCNVIAAASFRLAAGHGDALKLVAVCQRRADVGVLRERRAVVGLAGGIRRNRQRFRPDDQLAVHTGDGVVVRKCVVFQRVPGDFVGTFADIRLAAGNRHIRETFPVHEAALGDLVARRRQRLAVVGLVGGIRRQLDRDRRNGQRADLMLAEGVVGGHICFGRLVFHAVGLKLVGHGPDVELSMIGSEGYDQLVALCQRTGVVASSIPQQPPVVRSRPGGRGDDDDIRALRDGERAGAFRDGIVAFNEAVVLRVFDGVLDHAVVVRTVGHVGDAAGGGDAGDFTRHKAVAAHSDGRAGQRRAVVGLGRRLGGQGDGALRDGQLLRADNIAGVVRAGSADLNGHAVGNVLRGDRSGFGRPSLAVRAVLNGNLAAVFVGRARRSGGVGLAVVHLHNIHRVQRDAVLDVAGRRDVQIAVRVLDLDAAVVPGRRREVVRRQLHHVLADIGSLGNGALAVLQSDRDGRRGVRREAGNRLLGAGVDLAVMLAGDGDREFLGDRGDVQIAVRVLDRDLAVVRRRCREVVRRQTHHVLTGVGAGSLCFLALLQHNRDVRRGVRREAFDALLAAVVDLAAMVAGDGDRDLVEFEVYLQHESAVCGDGAGEDVFFVVRIKSVAGLLRGRIVGGDAGFRAGRAGAGPGIIFCKPAGLLVVILNGVLGVRARRPLGIEDVAVLLVHAGVCACRKGRAFAVRLGVPAGELIAQTGEAQFLRRLHRDLAVVHERRDRRGSSRAAVRVVGQLDGLFFVAVHGVERRARRRDGQLIVGLIGDVGAALFGRPTEEHLVRGRVVLGLLHVRLRAGCVVLAIGEGGVALNVRHRDLSSVGEIRIESNISVGNGIKVKRDIRVADLFRPADKYPVAAIIGRRQLIFRRELALVDFLSVADCKRAEFCIVSYGDIGSSFYRRLFPFGVDDHVVGGHLLAFKVMLLREAGIVVPAAEGEVFLSFGRFGDKGRAGNVRVKLIFLEYRVGAFAAELDGVAVAGVIESSAIIAAAYFRSFFVGKSSDGIVLLLSNRSTCPRGGVAVVEFILYAVLVDRSCLAFQNLDIVIGGLRATTGNRSVERESIVRHGFYADLACGSVCGGFPSAAAVNGGPLVADERAVFGGNAIFGVFFVFYIFTTETEKTALQFHAPEGDGIHLALEVYIDDRGAVARDGLFSKLVFRFFLVVVDRVLKVFVWVVGQPVRAGITGNADGVARIAGGFHGGIIGVSVVADVGVFDPVVNGIGGAALGFPIRGELNAPLQHPAERERGAGLVEPALERIAGLRRLFGFFCLRIHLIECRSDITAAIGIKGDPEARLYVGIQEYVAVLQRNFCGGFVRQTGVIVPADDGAVETGIVGNIGSINLAARHALHGMDNAIGRIDEEHIQHGRELRIRLDGLRPGDAGHRAERNGIAVAVFRGVPAGELVAVPLRGGGAEERFVILDDLLGDHILAYVKFVGAVFVPVGLDHRERNAVLPVLGELLVVGGFVLGFFSFGGLLRARGLFALGGCFAVLGFFSLGGLLRAGGLFALGGRFAVLGFFSLGGLLRAGGLFALGGRFAVSGFLALDRRGGFAVFAVLGGRLLLRGG